MSLLYFIGRDKNTISHLQLPLELQNFGSVSSLPIAISAAIEPHNYKDDLEHENCGFDVEYEIVILEDRGIYGRLKSYHQGRQC